MNLEQSIERFEGKVALITGGATGIGRAIAAGLAMFLGEAGLDSGDAVLVNSGGATQKVNRTSA